MTFDFGGTPIDVSLGWVITFAALCLVLVVVPIYFNRSINHEAEYIDERWGYGSIDDDEWGLSVAAAKRAVSARLADLADASEARRRA